MADYTATNVLVGLSSLKVDGTSVGYTKDGVSITVNAERIDLEVDQSYAPIGVHKVRETYEVKTNLAEASLANLKIVWEQTQSVATGVGTRTLSLGMNPDVVEHTLVFTGVSPEGLARTYTVYKAVIWECGDMEHKKDDITVIPVTFRILPDTTKSAGKEYGYIVDTTA